MSEAGLAMAPNGLSDTWLICHCWVGLPSQAQRSAVAPAAVLWPVTSRHLPWIRSVPSL